MSEGKVFESNTLTPTHTPISVVDLLVRNVGKIKNINCVVEWEDGTQTIAANTQSLKDLAYSANLMMLYANHVVKGDWGWD